MKESRRVRNFTTIGEARERDALEERRRLEIEKLKPLIEKLLILEKNPEEEFDIKTAEKFNYILRKIILELESGDSRSFTNAKLVLSSNINELRREDYKAIQKALGLIDENGKLAA